MIKMAKKVEPDKFKKKKNNRKIKSPFIIYADVEVSLVRESNEKENPDQSSTNKYQNHVVCSLGYKLVCVDDKFRKPFESYLGQDAVYKFITNMAKNRKYSCHVMKKHFNKELVMTKEDDENFESSTKC